ncbi:MAG: DUF1566 domain-containing protein, partial [Bacteroidales bacterium]|nr:DUF1566 domain-containing protein [Bacteroidales bacterium]
TGLVITGNFSLIDWSSGNYYLKTETDPTGGTNYTISGTSQFLSVPYALYAKSAANGFSGNYNDLTNKPLLFSGNYNDLSGKPTLFDGTWSSLTGKPTTLAGYGITDFDFTGAILNDQLRFDGSKWVRFTPDNSTHISIPNQSAGDILYYDGTNWTRLPKGNDGQVLSVIDGKPSWRSPHYIGESYGGGYIFYLDPSGLHGLIASPYDVGYANWGCLGTLIGGTGTSLGSGKANTTAIVNGCNENGIAAKICDALELSGFSDWYLPSLDELKLIYVRLIKNDLGKIGDYKSYSYWCSSEVMENDAWYVSFLSGGTFNNGNKSDNGICIIAIRSF